MECPNCGSDRVNVQIVSDGVQTTKKGVGLGGHINNAARGLTAVATLGLSNTVWKKSKGTNKSKIKNTKVAVCQDCGESWEVDDGKKKKGFGIAPSSIFK